MARYEVPQYAPWTPGFEPAHPLFVQMVPPAPLPWHVRHPTLVTLIVAVLLAAFAVLVR